MSIRPKKSLGQHFLKDENIINKIVDAIPAQKGDRVIEVGAGTGALTRVLSDRFSDLLAVELDERAVEVLQQRFKDVEIYQQNVLDLDWEDISVGKSKTHVVGNLPYYITSQILFSLLENRSVLAGAILMMQKEVAERLIADIRTKDYGILSVQTQLMSTPEILFPVSRNCFNPQPNVDSAMVKLTFDKGKLNCSDKNLKTVVRTAFNQRRKKLSNALKPIIPKDQLPEGFDFDKRAEAWPPSIYEKLTDYFEQNGILT
ncbi:16S rRNA (adenine(1518)-N(6)/adenine(1519)-N(6))-dimethyltransferase RsmA [Aliifodinibius salicampi]|uniref:Ribosomal RNA small subunit methyltransferase A n=1 Tax=Fodinibius salicampi TaxID=1920655 RepID=A0ABT3PZL7_9BACT|nr:16S rRNA (adenine(1518)-N(6)/adenine(1519)-N(6))-dimethyltransferase RsmA [Fodinibius salicampi]MCW9713270.1 16S rRNA (adenine(1518)-N(6)/adenine(1519)-N(6))-dimethyltransferase RsmA [Fodinibius salicampi]